MKYILLLLFLFYSSIVFSQSAPFCIEKSSTNSYVAGGDSSLSLYKTILQEGNSKILLFKIKPVTSAETIVIAKTGAAGNITWTRALVSRDDQYIIQQAEAIVLHDNKIFVLGIATPVYSSTQWMALMIWLDENGSILSQNAYAITNTETDGISSPENLKITECTYGSIAILSSHRLKTNSRRIGLITRISSSGTLEWQRTLSSPVGFYSPIGVISYNDNIILQSTITKGDYPTSTILNSTRLSWASGDLINGKSYIETSNIGGPGIGTTLLTDDHKIKTLAYWRIPYHYQIYFSFTQDSSLTMLRSTTFHTPSTGVSYWPVSSALNKRGMSFIKTAGSIDRTNTGYFINSIDDNIYQQKKIDRSQDFDNYTSGFDNEVAFDNADSVYLYWSGTKNGKGIVGWLKTGIYNTADFCSTKDSSFILKDEYPMNEYNCQLEMSPAGFYTNTSFPVNSFSPTITKEMICEKITGFCDPIKIKRLDTICSLTQPVRITVNKNPECRGSVLFRFDTLQVKTWQQLNDTTLLLEFDKSWNGYIYASASFCPLVKDSIPLVVNAPLPGITIGKDTVLCKGDSLVLYAGNDFAVYTWQNNSSGSSFIVKDGGVYYVTVKDDCSRYYSDTIRVKMIDKKIDLGTDMSICKKESIGLKVKGNFSSYQWGPSYNISNTNLAIVAIYPEISTNYYVTARTAEGCAVKDTILITVKDCPQLFYIPSAFTPNHDGKNDVFGPVILAPVEEYQFSIFNRWGQRIFYSTDKSNGWDGKINGIPQDSNTFIWMCNYKFYGQPVVVKNGSFILIR